MPDFAMPALLAAPLVALLAIIFVVAFPVTIPLVVLLIRLDEKHRKSAAAATRCPRCGLTLGAAAVEKADKIHSAHMAAMMNTSSELRKLRIVRRLHAV